MKLNALVCLSLLLLVASFATAQVPCTGTVLVRASLFVNWPQFQYDSAHTGCNPYETILNTNTVGSLTVKWQQQIFRGGYASGVVADGFLYTSVGQGDPFFSHSLMALNANTNAVIWSIAGENQTGFTTPTIAKGVVYAGSSDHNIYALNAQTGAVIWKFETGNIVESTPTIANGVVYVGSADHNVYALDANTGALIWKYTTGGEVDYFPAVANGMVYAGSLDRKLYALNATTGSLIWTYTTARPSLSAVVTGGKVYVGSDQVYALDAGTGALIWTYPAGGGSLSPAVARGTVYLTSEDSNVYALNGSTGALIWKHPMQDSTLYSTSAVVANGVVYANTDHRLSALDASTGAQLWTRELDGSANGWPVVANGTIFMGTSACDTGCSFGYLTAFSLPQQ